jgi:hypothetical protein
MIVASPWDLTVVDARGPAGAPPANELLETLRKASCQFVIITGPDAEHSFPKDAVDEIFWRLVDNEGQPLDRVPRARLQEVSFTLSTAEMRFEGTVLQLCEILARGNVDEPAISRSLLNASQSSPAAAERVLRQVSESQEGPLVSRFARRLLVDIEALRDDSNFWRSSQPSTASRPEERQRPESARLPRTSAPFTILPRRSRASVELANRITNG